jgi:hypothetical protein
VSKSTTELLLGWVSLRLKCPGESRTLSSLPSPQLQPPGGQTDRLLPKLRHDLSDPCQVGLAENEVTSCGPHVIADHAVLGRDSIAFRLGRDHIFSRVQ